MPDPVSIVARTAGPLCEREAADLLRRVVRDGCRELAVDDGELGRRLVADLHRLGPVVDRRGDDRPHVTAEVEQILDAVAAGATVAQAAVAANVSLRTAHRRLRLAADQLGVGSVPAAVVARHRQLDAQRTRPIPSVRRDSEVSAAVEALARGGLHLLEGPEASGVTPVLHEVARASGVAVVPALDLGRRDRLDLVLLERAPAGVALVVDDGQWLCEAAWELLGAHGHGVLVGGHQLPAVACATSTIVLGPVGDDDLAALHAELTGSRFGGRNRRDLLRLAAGRPGRVVQLTDPEAGPELVARLLDQEPGTVLAPGLTPPGGWLRSLLRRVRTAEELALAHRTLAEASTDPVLKAAHLAVSGDLDAAREAIGGAPEDIGTAVRLAGASDPGEVEALALRNEVLAALTDGADATAHADRAAAAYLRLGWVGDARRVALRTYQRLDRMRGGARQLGALAGIVGETGNVVEAMAMLDEALGRPDTSAADRTYLRMIRAGVALVSGGATSSDLSDELQSIAEDAASASLDDELTAGILPGIAQAMMGDAAGLDAAVAVFDELLPTIGVLPGAALKAAHLAELLGTLQARGGRPLDGLALMDQTLDHLDRRGESTAGVALALTRELLVLGLTGPQEEQLERVRAAMARNGDNRPSGAAGALLALQLADAGDLEGAAAALDQGRAAVSDPMGPELIRSVEAEVAYRAGDLEGALDLALDAIRRSNQVLNMASGVAALAHLIRLELTSDVEVPAVSSPQAADRWSVAVADAVDALLAGDPDGALEALAPEHVEPLIDARTPVLVGLVRARAQMAAGDPAAADRGLAEVEAGALARNEHGLVAQIRQLRRVAGTRATVRTDRRPTGASPLSDREIEMLGLVGAGLTSRQIAERLRVSPSTVDSTVRRAMAKLGAPTRRAAAAMVAGYR